MSDKIIPLIMCGGAGTRLWPLSRENRPKQFVNLFGERSTFQETMLRVSDPRLFDRPIVVTNALYRAQVSEQLGEIGCKADILLESARRDSGPAIAAGTIFAARRAPGAFVLALASDHVVKDTAAFIAACEVSLKVSNAGHIVTFGIQPERPASEYGYILPGAMIDAPVRAVQSFAEKPDLATAARYVRDGYLWNSGNLIFRSGVLLDEYRAVDPDSIDAVTRAVDDAERDQDIVSLNKQAFERARPISIDYAVMERTTRAAVIPVAFGWSDVGSWRAVWEMSQKDANGNAAQGRAVFENAHNCHVLSDNLFVALDGVDDLAVVITNDAVLVSRQADSSALRRLVSRLEGVAPDLIARNISDSRVSGAFDVIDAGDRYQVRRVVVGPGERLALQQDQHRSEHWVVVQGSALIDFNGSETTVDEGRSIFVPVGVAYSVENVGGIPLELIGVQTGQILMSADGDHP
jgi:mannose-1-phosphate guanylyltransferase/mannose-6-phosphate isomerase